MDFDKKLAEANAKLKAAKTGVAIARKGNRLWLRATLPPKPHINKSKSYQQEISLFLKTTPAGLQSAVIKAKQVGLELDQGVFDWYNWLQIEDNRGKVSYWLEKFEEDYWDKTAKTETTLATWKKDYQVVFNKFNSDESLTLEYLIKIIRTTKPDSRSRLKTCTYLHKLAKFAGIEEVYKIKELQGNYSPSSVQPRNLPTDKEIIEFRNSITRKDWQWVFGIIATYGLRNHEIYHLDLRDFPIARITGGKTGERFIYPLYPEWAHEWNLKEAKIPNYQTGISNSKLGEKVTTWFYGKFPFKAYDLRHCYARRCFEFGLTPDWSAGLMGHSMQVHLKTYRAWIDEATYRKAYEAVINRDGRPLPPE